MTRHGIVAVCVITLASGCSEKKDVINGLLTAGSVVAAVAAAAVFNAASGDCWGQCLHGYRCDRDRGVCVPGVDGASTPIELIASDDGCITEDDGRVLCPDDPATEHNPTNAIEHPPAQQAGDDCDGLCHEDERCRVIKSMAYCVSEDDPLYDR